MKPKCHHDAIHDTRSIVRSPDGYRDFIEITNSVLQGGAFAL